MSLIKAKTRGQKILRELVYAVVAITGTIIVVTIVQLAMGFPTTSALNPLGFGCHTLYSLSWAACYPSWRSELCIIREPIGYKCNERAFIGAVGIILAVWIVLRVWFLIITSLVRKRRRGNAPTPASSGRTKRGQG